MSIPYKLYMRMTELAAEYYRCPTKENDKALVTFQDEIRWPFFASSEQIKEWNDWHERVIVTPKYHDAAFAEEARKHIQE